VQAEAQTRLTQDLSVANAAKDYTDAEIAKVHTHANYGILSSITGKKVSQWENDAGYVTEKSLAGYALKKEIPTYVSQLENDAGYITSDGVPTKLSQFENDAGYQLKTVFRDWTEA